jgi:hypothetical protein
LEQKFQKRKRDLEESSEKFNQEMKKLRDDRPTFTEEKYREFASLWTDYIRQQYADHKAGKTASVEEPMEVSEEKTETAEVKEADAPNSASDKANESEKQSEDEPVVEENNEDGVETQSDQEEAPQEDESSLPVEDTGVETQE